MSDARFQTPLSESDYAAIHAAVMETARGRWFMAEYASRNRQADTRLVLEAVARLERALPLSAQPPRWAMADEAEQLLGDLRADLERLCQAGGDAGGGLARRIENAASQIAQAAERVQDVAWTLRETQCDDSLSETLELQARKLQAAAAAVEAGGTQIGKIADTVAMVDSSLRALSPSSAAPADEAPADRAGDPRPGLAAFDDAQSDLGSIGSAAAVARYASPAASPQREPATRRLGSIRRVEDDIVFDEGNRSDGAQLQRPDLDIQHSDRGLRLVEAMPDRDKLAYFA